MCVQVKSGPDNGKEHSGQTGFDILTLTATTTTTVIYTQPFYNHYTGKPELASTSS